MGSTTGDPDELPLHQVTLPSFQIAKTEVTVGQYAACVSAGVCSLPGTGSGSNWNVSGHEDHPVNFVDWNQALAFCAWAGGRLPTEAEWEYVARANGQSVEYPWGNNAPTCPYAVMNDGTVGCGTGGTWPVCSKLAGSAPNGLCDLSGNVYEWVQDWYHSDYIGAPVDGTPWETPAGSRRVHRGGSCVYGGIHEGERLRASDRASNLPNKVSFDIGIRCSR